MAIIRPISDLRNHANEVSRICHQRSEPVFITKNGKGDLVVMSQGLFDRQQAMLELYGKLEEAEREASSPSAKRIPHRRMMRILRDRMA
jgi:prevent-host-death family protein